MKPLSPASQDASVDYEPPLFTIITVCRNAVESVGKALESLAAQTFTDWEWIMVDGASTDATVAQANTLHGKGRRLKIISEPDTGIYNAMNKGLRSARGQYVYFLNADDALHDERVLEDVAQELRLLPDTDFLYGNILVCHSGQPDLIYCPQPPARALEEMVCGCIPHQGSFARLSLFLGEIGFFNEELRTAADYQWMMHAVSSPTVRLHYIDRAIAKYAGDGASSELEESLPESFKVLNENIAFQQAIGMPAIISGYQQQILKLRLEIRSVTYHHQCDRNKLTKELSKKIAIRAKLDAMKLKFDSMKLDFEAIKLQQRKRKSWLPKWLRF